MDETQLDSDRLYPGVTTPPARWGTSDIYQRKVKSKTPIQVKSIQIGEEDDTP